MQASKESHVQNLIYTHVEKTEHNCSVEFLELIFPLVKNQEE